VVRGLRPRPAPKPKAALAWLEAIGWHIACELVDTVRANVTIDWTLRENMRAAAGARQAHPDHSQA
jgi:hypothetical protein